MYRYLTLAVLAVLLTGCAIRLPVQSPAQPPAPTRILVKWADSMCESTNWLTSFATWASESQRVLSQSDPFGGLDADIVLSRANWTARNVASHLHILPRIGIPGADDLADRLTQAVDRIGPGVTAAAPESINPGTLNSQDMTNRVQQINTLFGSLPATVTDLPTTARANPQLAGAYNLAPQCTPLTPGAEQLPRAADGSNFAACAGGQCEILVIGSAEFVVQGAATRVKVLTREAVFSQTRMIDNKTNGNAAELYLGTSNTSGTLTVRLIAVSGNSAVLSISPT